MVNVLRLFPGNGMTWCSKQKIMWSLKRRNVWMRFHRRYTSISAQWAMKELSLLLPRTRLEWQHTRRNCQLSVNIANTLNIRIELHALMYLLFVQSLRFSVTWFNADSEYVKSKLRLFYENPMQQRSSLRDKQWSVCYHFFSYCKSCWNHPVPSRCAWLRLTEPHFCVWLQPKRKCQSSSKSRRMLSASNSTTSVLKQLSAVNRNQQYNGNSTDYALIVFQWLANFSIVLRRAQRRVIVDSIQQPNSAINDGQTAAKSSSHQPCLRSVGISIRVNRH